MKKALLFAIVVVLPFLVKGQNTDENYIKTTTYQVETTTGTVGVDDKIEAITYYDGLGRPVQGIGVRAGGGRENIMTYMEYDELGMQPKQYLPFATTGQVDLNSSLDDMNPTVLLDSLEYFYNTNKYDNTTNPFSEAVYENSPLFRVEEQGAPGNDWEVDDTSDNDHTIKYEYLLNNASSVMQFSVSFIGTDYSAPSLVYDGYYPAKELYLTRTRDENWQTTDGIYGKTYEYKNKKGQLILKRISVDDLVEGPQIPNYHDTYFIYDMFGNLTYVLSPEGSENILNGSSIDTDVLDNLCYQYKYDDRNRLIRKKIPGKGWEYIFYDRMDRHVLTQDAVQRTKNPPEYLFTKYDALDRVVYTGLFTSTSTPTQIENTLNTATSFYEARQSTSTSISGTIIYYSNTVFPTSSLDVLTINYYDDDDNLDLAGLSLPTSVYGINPNNSNTKGLPTVNKSKVLETSYWITSLVGYDEKARSVYGSSYNGYFDTTDKLETKIDFSGKVIETKSTHQRTGFATIEIEDYFYYDHMGRLITHDQKIDNEPVQLISESKYDELGKPIRKDVGGESVVDGYTGIAEADVSFDGTITRNTPGPGWTSGAYTKGEIISDGGVSYTIPQDDKYVRVGLETTVGFIGGWDDYDYGIHHYNTSIDLDPRKDFKIEVAGTIISYNGNYDPDDTFSIERSGGNIVYKQNGATIHTATYSGSDTFVGKTGIFSGYGSVEDFTIFGGNIDKKLQNVDYTYNIRGWLTEINKIVSPGEEENPDLFNLKINYNNIDGNSSGTKLYNGNIVQTIWRSQSSDKNIRSYNYEYDDLNRIISATGYKGSTISSMTANTAHDLTGVSYDYNGNITALSRNGAGTTETTQAWDDLTYTYYSGTNQLRGVTENALGIYATEGFNDGNTTLNPDYEYDANGNMIKDLNKGIDVIEYNHLNLPIAVRFDPNLANPSINYIYDATGVKLSKSVVDEGSNITEYAGNFIYSGLGTTALEFISHPEGYIMPVAGTSESTKGSSGGTTTYSAYEYVFQYKDHLGNVRLSYSDSNLDGAISASTEIIEESNYYPFGLKQNGYNTIITSNGNDLAQQWKYNGIQYSEDFGLNLYEMDMRQYDPAIARWTSIDPVVHHSMSTYTAFDNNPVFWADPSGADSDSLWANGDGESEAEKEERKKGRSSSLTKEVGHTADNVAMAESMANGVNEALKSNNSSNKQESNTEDLDKDENEDVGMDGVNDTGNLVLDERPNNVVHNSPSADKPDPDSFRFTTRGNWQTAAVKDIHFSIVLVEITPKGIRFEYKNRVLISNVTLFGMPSTLSKGPRSISNEVASELTADIVNLAMRNTAKRFYKSTASPMEVEQYFRNELSKEYSIRIPGARVNFNSMNYLDTPTIFRHE